MLLTLFKYNLVHVHVIHIVFLNYFYNIHLLFHRFQLGAKDSMDTICEDDELEAFHYSQKLKSFRREHNNLVVGIKREPGPIKPTNNTGYQWKKKWKDRREKSKQVSSLLHQNKLVIIFYQIFQKI